ncbi:hypothetical protein [Actinoplanes italicus]|uniref:Protein kinase-like protein n=1 Tax=Actinoplanes italicus TaxID=113567 RepID=A0A2T0K720_9ACTN|nr:hypothetical protein [Actinoplanes italicus]PRX18547.1 protein kinase-like protein [Actinoplanes italicus]
MGDPPPPPPPSPPSRPTRSTRRVLRVAHREGIAHRDVEPADVLLEEERVVLTDFGIAAIDTPPRRR